MWLATEVSDFLLKGVGIINTYLTTLLNTKYYITLRTPVGSAEQVIIMATIHTQNVNLKLLKV